MRDRDRISMVIQLYGRANINIYAQIQPVI